jgi:Excalibur calcium-binding domain
MRRSLLAVTAAAALLPLGGVVVSADAATPKHYKSCKALNKAYPHGVGRKGARDRTSEERVTNFTRNNKVYTYNDGKGANPPREHDLDRDNDGIACERL